MTKTMREFCNYCSNIFKLDNDEAFKTSAILLPVEAINTIQERLWCRICAIVETKLRPYHEAEKYGVSFSILDSENLLLRIRVEQPLGNKSWRNITDLAMLSPELANNLVYSQTLPNNTGSPESTQFLKTQLSNCIENHHTCSESSLLRYKSAPRTGPSRLLWVNGLDQSKIYLRHDISAQYFPPQEDRERGFHYATLSHCWGQSVLPLLTQASLNGLVRGIAISMLPKTFRDTVQMTRNIGLDYLWIDSLCILQDNLDDWSSEAARMHDIYSNAVCNIAATGAKDSSHGLFSAHSQLTPCPFWIDVSWPADVVKMNAQAKRYLLVATEQWEDSVEMAALNRRAWVMQERVLSKRVMNFAQDQVFWECLEVRSNETFPRGIPSAAKPNWMYDKLDLKRLVYTGKAQKHMLDLNKGPARSERQENSRSLQKMEYGLWRNFLISYTRCELTKPGDKLVAVQGIAQAVAAYMDLNLKDIFVSGLWVPQLCLELCWFNFEDRSPSRPTKWRAPSWSWASVDAQIHPSSMRHHIACEGLTEEIRFVNIETCTEKSGEIRRASLRVKGKLIPAFLSCDINGHGHMIDVATVVSSTPAHLDVPQALSSTVYLDVPEEDREVQGRRDVLILPILTCVHNPSRDAEETSCWSESTTADALIVIQHKSGGDKYTRIGLVRVEHIRNPNDSYLELRDSVRASTLTLI